MKKNAALLALVLLGVLLLSGCTQEAAHRSYTNSMYSFSVDPPAGWKGKENVSAAVAVRFTPENTSNVSLAFSVPFSLSEGRSLSTFADETVENLSANGVNYTVVYQNSLIVGELGAYELVYSYHQGSTLIQVKQVTVLRTRTVYIITFTAPFDLYNQYIDAVDRCVDSFS
jgi:hypothetical protein